MKKVPSFIMRHNVQRVTIFVTKVIKLCQKPTFATNRIKFRTRDKMLLKKCFTSRLQKYCARERHAADHAAISRHLMLEGLR